jgi:GTP cyclohydrolase I
MSRSDTGNGFNRQLCEEGATLLLRGLGVDLTDHNFATTPKRVADVYQELFSPKESGWPVFDEEYTDIVIVKGHRFWTMCPHHLLPVEIRASVAYFPNGKVIGASKLCRLIHEVNRKPLTQEKLTDLICQAIKEYTGGTSKGEAVLLEGEHDCFKIRGIKSEARMITYKFKGCFEEAENQKRFLQLVRL